MGPVDLMCCIVLNCQELNCRACDNLGFLLWAAVVGPAGPASLAAELERCSWWDRSAAGVAGAAGERVRAAAGPVSGISPGCVLSGF